MLEKCIALGVFVNNGWYFVWSPGCVLFQLDAALELIHLLFFAHWDSELHARANREYRSNNSKNVNQISLVVS